MSFNSKNIINNLSRLEWQVAALTRNNQSFFSEKTNKEEEINGVADSILSICEDITSNNENVSANDKKTMYASLVKIEKRIKPKDVENLTFEEKEKIKIINEAVKLLVPSTATPVEKFSDKPLVSDEKKTIQSFLNCIKGLNTEITIEDRVSLFFNYLNNELGDDFFYKTKSEELETESRNIETFLESVKEEKFEFADLIKKGKEIKKTIEAIQDVEKAERVIKEPEESIKEGIEKVKKSIGISVEDVIKEAIGYVIKDFEEKMKTLGFPAAKVTEDDKKKGNELIQNAKGLDVEKQLELILKKSEGERAKQSKEKTIEEKIEEKIKDFFNSILLDLKNLQESFSVSSDDESWDD